MMKLIFTLLLFFTFSTNINSQINVGSLESVTLKPGKFKKGDIDLLKKTKTIFVCRNEDNIKELERELKKVWTITEISVEPESKFNTKDLEGKSFFSFGAKSTTVQNLKSGASRTNSHPYLSLWMPIKSKKKKISKKSFSRIELHFNKDGAKNWNVGFLKNYLKNVNDLLTKQSLRWLYTSDYNSKKLSELKKKTLYVPEYALIKFNKFTGDESEFLNEDEIFKSYTFDYKMIKSEELSKKIIESEESFYYLIYIKSSTDKYITIYDSKSGEIIYSKYKAGAYNIKNSDFKSLNKLIEKSK